MRRPHGWKVGAQPAFARAAAAWLLMPGQACGRSVWKVRRGPLGMNGKRRSCRVLNLAAALYHTHRSAPAPSTSARALDQVATAHPMIQLV